MIVSNVLGPNQTYNQKYWWPSWNLQHTIIKQHSVPFFTYIVVTKDIQPLNLWSFIIKSKVGDENEIYYYQYNGGHLGFSTLLPGYDMSTLIFFQPQIVPYHNLKSNLGHQKCMLKPPYLQEYASYSPRDIPCLLELK